MGAATLVLAICMFAPPAMAEGYLPPSRLYASDGLHPQGFGLYVEKTAGDRFMVYFQADCDLVLYHNGQAYWDNGSSNSGQDACHLAMQRDGDLVIYGDNSNKLWESNPAQSTQDNYYLEIQVDGNLVVYNLVGGGNPVWASGTNWF